MCQGKTGKQSKGSNAKNITKGVQKDSKGKVAATVQAKAKAHAKTAAGPEKPAKLTAKAILKQEPASLTLDEKMKLLAEKGSGAVQLSGSDFTKLNLRFTQTALAKMPPQIQEAWKEASVAKTGKQQKQHSILAIFAEHPAGGKHFLNRIYEIQQTKKNLTESEWVSRKLILQDMDESECEEMVEYGTLEVRKNPLNSRRLQYRKVTVKEIDEASKTKKTVGASSCELAGDKALGVMNAMDRNFQSTKFKAMESSDEEIDIQNKAPAKRPKPDPNPNIPKKLKLDDAGLASLTDADFDTIAEMSRKLSTSMHGVVNLFKSQQLQFAQTMYATPAKTKELKLVLSELEENHKKLDVKVVKGQVSLKELKASFACWSNAKIELGKLEKIVMMDDTASTARYSARGKASK